MATVLASPTRPSTSTETSSRSATRTGNTAWRRFTRDRVAIAALGVLALLALLAVAAPLIASDPSTVDLDAIKKPPSLEHPLGTDSAGRDVWARMVYGARVSMSVGLVAVGIASAIGMLIGLVAGYVGGRLDNALMRFTELIQTFPLFFAVVILVALVGPNVFNVMAVIGFLSWPGLARLIRGQVLSLRAQQFVESARAMGAGWLAYRVAASCCRACCRTWRCTPRWRWPRRS